MVIGLVAQVNAVGQLIPWLLSLGAPLSSESELEKNVFICHLNIVGRFSGDDVGIPYNLKMINDSAHIPVHDAVTLMGSTWLVFFPSPFEEGTRRFRLAFSAFGKKSPGILPCFSIERALELIEKGVDGVEERVGATVPALDSSDGFGAPSFILLPSLNSF